MNEDRLPESITFYVCKADDTEGGYCASSMNLGIFTQGDNLDELYWMIRDAIRCRFNIEDEYPPTRVILEFIIEGEI